MPIKLVVCAYKFQDAGAVKKKRTKVKSKLTRNDVVNESLSSRLFNEKFLHYKSVKNSKLARNKNKKARATSAG